MGTNNRNWDFQKLRSSSSTSSNSSTEPLIQVNDSELMGIYADDAEDSFDIKDKSKKIANKCYTNFNEEYNSWYKKGMYEYDENDDDSQYESDSGFRKDRWKYAVWQAAQPMNEEDIKCSEVIQISDDDSKHAIPVVKSNRVTKRRTRRVKVTEANKSKLMAKWANKKKPIITKVL
jgi:hypothetical protein